MVDRALGLIAASHRGEVVDASAILGSASRQGSLLGTGDKIAAERHGIAASQVKALIHTLGWSESQMVKAIGLAPTSWNRKKNSDALIDGAPGYAVISLQALLERAEGVVTATVDPDVASSFDVGGWLGRWLLTSMPALAGGRPADYLDVPSGQVVVMHLLGSLESGSYQ